MAKLKRLTVTDYKMQSKKEQYTDDATDVFSGEISAVIAYLQGILYRGYTHLNSEKWVDHDYGFEFAMCETKYYKIREETDEEYEKRCESHRKQREMEKVKAGARKAAREVAMRTLALEQRDALGIR
jgi:hypothetical protein